MKTKQASAGIHDAKDRGYGDSDRKSDRNENVLRTRTHGAFEGGSENRSGAMQTSDYKVRQKFQQRLDAARKIPGWSADLDKKNRPGVPMEKTPTNGAHWTAPEDQTPKVTIFRSVELPKLTHVFGSTCPPKGLSGIRRGYAYTLGEDQKRRWMTLIFADRIDVIEGKFSDLVSGNQHPETLRFKRNLAIGLGVAAAAAGVGLYLAKRSPSPLNVAKTVE